MPTNAYGYVLLRVCNTVCVTPDSLYPYAFRLLSRDMKEIKMVLADLFLGETQSATTARLASGGMRDVYQGKVSRWLNNVQPSLEQLAEIERIYGQPRGWILWSAGFVDAATLTSATTTGS